MCVCDKFTEESFSRDTYKNIRIMFSTEQLKEIESVVRRVMTTQPKPKKARTSPSSAPRAPVIKMKVGKHAFQSDDPDVVQYFNTIVVDAECVIPKKPKDFFGLSDENARVFIVKTLRTLVAHGAFDTHAKFVALFVHDALAFTLVGRSPFADVHRVALLAFVGSTECFARRGKVLEALSESSVYEELKEAAEAEDSDIVYEHVVEAPEKPSSKKKTVSAVAVVAAPEEPEDDSEAENVFEDEDVQATGVFDGFLGAPVVAPMEPLDMEDDVEEDFEDDVETPSVPVVAPSVSVVAPSVPFVPLELVPALVTGVPVAPEAPVVSTASEFKRAAPETPSVSDEPVAKRVCPDPSTLRKWEPMDVDVSGMVVLRGEEMSYEKWRSVYSRDDNNKYERYTRVSGEVMDVIQYYREFLRERFPSANDMPVVQLKVRYVTRR